MPDPSPPTDTNAIEPEPRSPFAGDRPWRPGDDDQLRRVAFARRIADTIAAHPSREGLVVGVYGPWGEGKTSVLHMVEARLKEHDVEAMWFNPWYFREQDSLVLTFLHQLAGRIEAKLGTRADEFKRVLDKYGSLLSSLPTSLVGMDPGAPLTAVGKQIGGSTLEDLKNQLEQMLVEKKIDVVVFMDDIDRLDRREIQAVLKLVKLAGGFNHVTYVLAFDDEMVAAAVGEAYGGDREAGRNFLEKIVQVPLRLPRVDAATGLNLTLAEVDRALKVTAADEDLTEQQAVTFRRFFDPIFEARPRTLRAAKRYGNALTFALPLLKGEANIGDLLLLEALRSFTPSLYAALPRYRRLLIGSSDLRKMQEKAKKSWQRLLAHTPAPERKAVGDALEHLFPRLRQITQNMGYGPDWGIRWAQAQRVASDDYFDRYFQYAVPLNDVSDLGVRQLLDALEAADLNEALRRYDQLLTAGNAGRLVDKLRLTEDTLSPVAARTLVRLLVQRGGGLPRPRSFFGFDVPQAQAVILAVKAIRRIPLADRTDVALEVVSEPTSIGFAAEFFSFVRYTPSEGDKPRDRTLDEAGETRVTTMLSQRLSEATAECPIYLASTTETRFLLSMWGHLAGRQVTQSVLATRFAEAPGEAARFIAAMAGQPWGMESGLPLAPEIEREDYDAMTRLVDATTIIESLRRVFGEAGEVRDGEEDEPSIGQRPADVVLARRFVYLHNLIKSRQEQATASRTDDADDTDDVEGSEGREGQASS